MHNNEQERHSMSGNIEIEAVRQAAAKSRRDEDDKREDEPRQMGYRFDAFMRIIRD